MSQIKNIVAVLMIAVYLENILTLGNPLVLKKLQVDRENRQKDGSARCMKVCPESGELDWILDWFFYDDEDCFYVCNITISDELKPNMSTPKISQSTDTKPRKENKKPNVTVLDKNKTFNVKTESLPY